MAKKYARKKTAAKKTKKAAREPGSATKKKRRKRSTASKKKAAKKAKRKSATKSSLKELLLKRAPEKMAASPEKPPSFSTHKARAGWFNAREAWPHREAPLDLLLRARARASVAVPQAPGSALWEQAGPTNVGGRMTCLAMDPNDAGRLWAGAAGGGVWSSTDGGRSWATVWNDEPSLNVGAICIDPSNPQVLYCGTGEANLSADSHPGVGLYRSMDAGASWHLLAPSNSHGLPRRIGRVAVDPFDSNRIFVGGVGHQPTDARGLFVSSDGGSSWALVTGMINSTYQCHEVLFHPRDQGTLYATIDANGFQTGVWKTANGGQSWDHLQSGLPHPTLARRISLAISPSNPKVVYAQVATASGGVRGLFRSANGGDTWNSIGRSHFSSERQMNYNNTIAVDPANEKIVICGGVDIHRTNNAGASWKKLTKWNLPVGDPQYAHADQHAIHFHPSQPGLVYALNDGGMDVSLDGGDTWANRSNGLATNMFYDLSAAATDSNMYGGGFQDNGTQITINGRADEFLMVTGGDGGFCAIDPNDKMHIYTSSQHMHINRFRQTDGWKGDIGPNELGPRPWMAFLTIDPDRPKRVFAGSQRVWRTKNDASTWSDVSGVLDASFISCIEISRANTDHIYVGTENGGIFKSEDGGDSWTGNIASSVLPGRTITRLRTPANDEKVIYASVANFGNSHLFRSVDGGASWSDVDSGNLPDAPLHGIAIPSIDSDRLYVGGDAGVFLSTDAGATWSNLSMNLPTVMVVDVVLQESVNALLAATYGRSTWRLDLAQIP